MRTRQPEVNEVTLQTSFRSTYGDVFVYAGTALVFVGMLASMIR
jgi:hypothetical protein